MKVGHFNFEEMNYMNKISKIAMGTLILGILFAGLVGLALSQESPVVNVMIDMDTPSPISPENINVASDSLINMINEIDPKGRNITIFVSGEMATLDRLGVTLQGTMTNHELALYGNNSGEDLSSLSAEDQKALLTDANSRLYHCYVCGGKHVNIKGFRPQKFEQNDDTLKALESLGIIYNAGFQEGLIYLPGHENDTWPYLISGHKLYAVPVSTASIQGERMVLYDKYAKDEKKLSGSQWSELLQKKFDESMQSGSPVTVIFSSLVSGDGEYLDAYRNFLDYAESQGANFVTTLQLVNMAAAKSNSVIPELDLANKGGADVSVTEKGSVADCPTCDETSKGATTSMIMVKVQKNRSSSGNSSNNCTTCDQISANSTKAA